MSDQQYGLQEQPAVQPADPEPSYRPAHPQTAPPEVAAPEVATSMEEPPADAAQPEPPHTELPHTGDLVIDAALRELADASPQDLDGLSQAAGHLEGVLRGRLSEMPGAGE